MAKIIKELSVFLPTYNEEKNISVVVSKIKKVLEEVATRWEIIIVEDGSNDDTFKVSQKLTKKDNRIKVVAHKVNQGYGGALKTGFKSAKYEWVAFVDSDDQFDFGEITKFIELKDQADLILGIRKKRADPFVRKIYTKVWSHILPRVLLGLKVTDYSCGFKMIKREVYEAIQPLKGEEKVTQIEMLTKAQRFGYKFSEVKVGHYPRKHGKQTGADIKVIMRSVRDLLKLWWQLK